MGKPHEVSLNLHFARLSALRSVWVRESAGGYLWLAQVLHDGDTFTVGPWHLLPGGWQHMATFAYSGGLAVSRVASVVLTALDESRILLAFALGGVNYAMVVRAGTDGTFASGQPINFPAGAVWDGATYVYGSLPADAFLTRTGPGRAVLVCDGPAGSGGDVRQEGRVFTAADLVLSVSVPVASPDLRPEWATTEPNSFYKPVYSEGTDGGWWGYRTYHVPASAGGGTERRRADLAWFRELGGEVVRGPVYRVADMTWSSSQGGPIVDLRTEEAGTFVMSYFMTSTGSFGEVFAGAISFRRLSLRGDEVIAEAAWSGNPSSMVPSRDFSNLFHVWFAPMGRRHLVDMFKWSTSSVSYRQFRQVVFGETTFTHPSSVPATPMGSYSDPPDQNVNGPINAKLWRLAGDRLMALFAVAGHHTVVDMPYVAALRLVTMVVPPVCAPHPGPAELAGTPLVRVNEPAAVVRMAPAGALAPSGAREPCPVPVGALGSGAMERVHPVGARR